MIYQCVDEDSSDDDIMANHAVKRQEDKPWGEKQFKPSSCSHCPEIRKLQITNLLLVHK